MLRKSLRVGGGLGGFDVTAGVRAFDHRFMGEDVSDNTFSVVVCDLSEASDVHGGSKPLGRHLDSCRIGFDRGASEFPDFGREGMMEFHLCKVQVCQIMVLSSRFTVFLII